MNRRAQSIGVIIVFLVFSALLAIAQLPTATILGVVKDASGAVIPDASFTVRNLETGLTRNTVSAADGTYRFPALPVGRYEIRVEHPGFQSEVRTGLTLEVSQEAVVNISLQVGAVEQTVAVTAEAPLVNTTSGSLGGLVSEQKMADLPLNGRNYVDLTLLQMGVNEQKTIATGVNSSGITGTYFSSNGAPVRSNNYLLDGAIMLNLWGATSASVSNATLGVEGIREYKVITNSFSAEYGMTMGSQMILVSKGGTNNFRGSLFEYLRNSALDARNFFDYKSPASQRRLPAFTRNNFGGSFGGPIKKDKSFFFGVFEGLRERKGITTIANVIPPSAKLDGGLVPQIAPVTKPLLTLFPDPNLPNNQYTFPFTQPTAENYGQIRVDQNFSSKDSLFVRYTIDDGNLTAAAAYPQFPVTAVSRQQFGTLSENRIISPALLNTFRFSLSRTNTEELDSPTAPRGPGFSFVFPTYPVGGINIGGITSTGSTITTPFLRKQNIFTYSDDIFYTRGRHALKFGTLINHYQQLIGLNTPKGSASFANLTSFLLAQPTTISGITPDSLFQRTFHYNTLGFYGQDDLRIFSNLTFNLGLRYEFNTVPQEQHGQWGSLRDIQHDAQFAVGSALYENPSLRNFSPRFGFAWDVMGNGKTAVRGGFGELYDVGQTAYLIIQSGSGNPPFTIQRNASNPPVFTIPLTFPANAQVAAPRPTDWLLQQPHLLQYNLAVERQLPFDMVLTLAYAGSRGINLLQLKEGNPTIPQILPDGRQFWPVNSPRTNPNWATLDLFTAGGNSWYNSLQFGLLKRLSKGLQFQSSYTWSRSLDENTSYTNVENTGGQNSHSTDPVHRNVDRGLYILDVTQVWKFNTIYRLPELNSSGGVVGKALNGWWVSGILSLQSGLPFDVVLNTNRSRSGVNGGAAGLDRPDLVPGTSIANVAHGTSVGCFGFPAGTPIGNTAHYYDPCAFSLPAAGFLGTAGRNILRGPGYAGLDFSVVKDTAIKKLGESGKLEFRAEFFNILNRPNFNQPNRTVFAASANQEDPLATAGQITSTVGTSRQIQLALKILF